MTSISHLFSDLSASRQSVPQGGGDTASEEGLEDIKLASFEAGYQAGWDDAIKSRSDEAERLTSDFVQAIEDMSFTYHEAYAKLAATLRPLLSSMITQLLPQTVTRAVEAHLLEQLDALIDAGKDNAIELAVAPDKVAYVRDLLEQRLTVPFTVAGEEALSSGQAYLRVNKVEREINLDAVRDTILAALDTYLDATGAEVSDD